MMLRKLLYAIALPIFLLLSIAAIAQEKRVTGRVTDATGKGVPGVSVTVKGQTRGAISSDDGSFSLTVPNPNTTLVASSVGFVAQEVSLNGRSAIDIVLQTAAGNLNEVVVIGYGTQRRREVTGAISKVSADKIVAVPTPSFEAALQGRVAGVQVSQSSLAGGASYVRIRGIASVSAGGDPLYVIDGIPVTSDVFSYATGAGGDEWKIRSGFQQNPLAAINPNDIESIEVLKDAGAAGIYGSRGANGVILITTKRGRNGKPQFNFSSKLTGSRPSVRPEFVNTTEWMQLRQEAWENDGNTGLAPTPFGLSRQQIMNTNTDWWDLLTRTGLSQDYSLSMSLGSNKYRYFVSGNFNNDESFAVGNKFQRYGIRNNFDYTFSPKFKTSVNLAWNRGVNYRIASGWAGGIGAAQREALPFLKPYNDDGSYFVAAGRYNRNPLMQINEMQWRSVDDRFLGGVSFDYVAAKNLTLRAAGNIDYFTNNQDRFESAILRNTPLVGGSDRFTNDIYNYNANLTANYNYEVNDQNKFTFLLGTEYQYSQANAKNYFLYDTAAVGPFWKNEDLLNHPKTAIGYPNQRPNVEESKWKIADRWAFISYFTRVNYSYKSKLFLQALARIDGSSRFGPNNRFGFFPSVSAAYILTEDAFFREALPFFSNLKLRTSYGITGNANIPSFQYLQTWTYQRTGTNLYNGQPILYPNNLENPDLKWERLNNFDAGLEFGLFKGRLTGEVAYYNKISRDVLLQVNLSPSIGLGGQVFRNVGKVKNEGLELTANLKLVDKKDFTISINGNAARNYNEVLDLQGIGPDDINTGTDEGRLLTGYPLGTRYSVVYLGVDPADGYPIFLGENGKSTKTWPGLNARRPVGKNIPDWVGGFGGNVTYKNFELTTLFVFSTGLNIWDNSGKYQFFGVGREGIYNFRKDYLDHWRQPGDVTRYPRLSYGNNYPGWPGLDIASSSMLVHKGDYLRMRELTLAYRFGGSLMNKLHLRSARLFVTGTNLLLFTDYPAGDPEINRDADGGVTARNMNPNVNFLTPPQPKSITVGLNVSF